MAFVVGGVGLAYVMSIVKAGENTFYPGVYVDGVELHNATVETAYEYIRDQARERLGDWAITLHYEGDKTWTITPEVLQMQLDVADQINKAWQQGRTGGFLERYFSVMALQATPYHGYTTIRYNEYSLDSLLREIEQAVNKDPVDATRTPAPNRTPPFIYTQESSGLRVNTQALKQEILEKVTHLEAGALQVQPEVVPPALTMADLQNDYVRLSSYRTRISSQSTPERNRNIEIGCEKFNGLTVKAGQKLSFNETTGKRTKENGYQEALEIQYGEYVWGYGGGICQVSSTLYNAVIQAGLEVVTRSQHGAPVNYMDSMGLDATVADRGTDFVFRNTTEHNITISARVEKQNGNLYCIIDIYGRPDPNGFDYKLESTITEELPIPVTTPTPDRKQEYVVYDNQIKEVTKGSVGYVVEVYKVTLKDGKVVDRQYLYTDRYNPKPAEVYVGVTPSGR